MDEVKEVSILVRNLFVQGLQFNLQEEMRSHLRSVTLSLILPALKYRFRKGRHRHLETIIFIQYQVQPSPWDSAAIATMIEEPTSTSLKASLLSVEQPSSAFTSLEKTLFDMRSDCEMQEKDFEMLQQLEGNTLCIDCGTANPDWGSPSLGILFCFQCSGQHRGLGTHISFVRSVTLDQWTDQQMALMRIGGNNQCRSFLETHGMDFHSLDIRQRYDSLAAALYRQVLLARSQGKIEPTELLETANQTRPQVCLKDKIQGFGSSPMPEPESEVNLKMSAVVLLLSLTAGAGLAVYFWR